jgi:hypothetical protein
MGNCLSAALREGTSGMVKGRSERSERSTIMGKPLIAAFAAFAAAFIIVCHI